MKKRPNVFSEMILILAAAVTVASVVVLIATMIGFLATEAGYNAKIDRLKPKQTKHVIEPGARLADKFSSDFGYHEIVNRSELKRVRHQAMAVYVVAKRQSRALDLMIYYDVPIAKLTDAIPVRRQVIGDDQYLIKDYSFRNGVITVSWQPPAKRMKWLGWTKWQLNFLQFMVPAFLLGLLWRRYHSIS